MSDDDLKYQGLRPRRGVAAPRYPKVAVTSVLVFTGMGGVASCGGASDSYDRADDGTFMPSDSSQLTTVGSPSSGGSSSEASKIDLGLGGAEPDDATGGARFDATGGAAMIASGGSDGPGGKSGPDH